ncbi:MAG: hypothetical protein NVSMB44_18850 [Ktedonobacteraceae bacterium]
MSHPTGFRTFAKVVEIILLLLLIGFGYVPFLSGGDAHYINQAASQRARSLILMNAAYTLEYRPVAERTQALRDLQSTLPVFEQEQAVLLINPARDVQDLLQQARFDYLPLVAVHFILAHANSHVDPVEVNIIALHVRGYITTMYAVLFILPRHIEDRNIQLFVIQIVIEVVFLVMFFLALGTYTWEVGREKSREKISLPMSFIVRRVVACVIVLVMVLVLVGVEMIPLSIESEMASFEQATLQRTQCEVFAWSALTLASRPTAEKTQAYSDIQAVLPIFQQEHATLLANRDVDIHHSLQTATAECQTMIVAAQTLSTQTRGTVDPAVINTIVSHASRCFATINNIIVVFQNQIDHQMKLIFYTEATIEGVLIAFFGGLLLFLRGPLIPMAKELKEARTTEVPIK